MTKFAQLLIAGLATGSLYALMAFGLVLIYRCTATINFAHGMLATIGAWGFAVMVQDYGWNVAVAGVLLLPLGAVAGLITYRVAVYPMVNAGALERTIATIVWMVILRAGFNLVFEADERNVPALFSHDTVTISDVAIAKQQIGAVAITIIGCVGLFGFFRYSKFGLASRAVALGREAARVAGLPLLRVDALSWALGGVVAAIGGAMIAPFTLATVDSLNQLLIRVFAAALVGLMTSLPLALAGGLFIGVAEQFLQGYVQELPELRELLPFIIVMAVLARFALRPGAAFGTERA